MATGNFSQRIEKLEAQIGVSQRIMFFEELMAFMYGVLGALEKGIPLDELPKKTYDPSLGSWALQLAAECDQRIAQGEALAVAEISWLLAAFYDDELRSAMPVRVRETVEEFLELSRQGRLRLVDSDVLGGELHILPEQALGNTSSLNVT